jgi:hypothetical protein
LVNNRSTQGICRQPIANGLARLEQTGIVKIVRRLVRARVDRISPITGEPESFIGTVQTTSLYSLHRPGAWADHLERPAGRRAPFPCKRQLDLLQAMALSWKTKLSLAGRKEPPPPVQNGLPEMTRANLSTRTSAPRSPSRQGVSAE